MQQVSGWGDFLTGTFQNTISRVVDMEFKEEYGPGNVTPVAKAEATPGAATIAAGKPSTANIGGLAVAPWMLAAGVGVLVLVLLLARR